jgi:hypothetical protein
MDAERATVWGVVGIVVVTTLVSGPLVDAVDLTTESSHDGLGTGTVTVDSASLPDRGTLTAGRFGAGEYTLRVPDATLELAAVEGRPVLVYRLSIPERGYTRSSTYFLSAGDAGAFSVAPAEDNYEPNTVGADAYGGRLQVIVRANDSSRVIAERSITVAVVE